MVRIYDSNISLSRVGIWHGMRRLLPVSLFVIPYGIGFGGAAAEAGLTTGQTIAMSATVFAGAAQFAALDFWPEPDAYLSLVLMALAVNARHTIMGAALAFWLNRLSWPKRLLTCALITDANFADSQRNLNAGENDLGILVGGGLIMWTMWQLGTVIGATAGHAIDDLDAYGVDVVMVCFFAAVVSTDLRGGSKLAPVTIAVAVSVLTLDFLPAGWNVIAAALAGGTTAALRHVD